MAAHVPPVADERESLIAYLDQQRDAFVTVAHGLTEEQIRLAPPAGTLTTGALIRHARTGSGGGPRGWPPHPTRRPHPTSHSSSSPPPGATTSASRPTTRSSRSWPPSRHRGT